MSEQRCTSSDKVDADSVGRIGKSPMPPIAFAISMRSNRIIRGLPTDGGRSHEKACDKALSQNFQRKITREKNLCPSSFNNTVTGVHLKLR